MESKLLCLKIKKSKLLLNLEEKESDLVLLELGMVTFEISQLEKLKLRQTKNIFDEHQL